MDQCANTEYSLTALVVYTSNWNVSLKFQETDSKVLMATSEFKKLCDME